MSTGLLLLCHRRRRDVGREAFFGGWASERATLAANLRQGLGFDSYFQVHRVSRWNVVYVALRLSRSWIVTAAFSLLRGLVPTAPFPMDVATRVERWDLVEIFVWPDGDNAMSKLTASESLQTLAKLEDSRANARRTVPLLARRRGSFGSSEVVALDTVVLFCLRPRGDLTRRAMLRYWLEEHGPFVSGLQADLAFARYEQLAVEEGGAHPMPQAPRGHRTPPFYGIAVLAYPRLADLTRGLFRPRTQVANARLVWDEVGFIDARRSALILGRVRHRHTG